MLNALWELIRKYAPHPGYGRCVGRDRDCSIEVPQDPYDRAGELHDKELKQNKVLYTLGEIDKKEKKRRDTETHKRFANNLRSLDPKEIPSKYGRVHWWFAKTFFRP